MADIDALSDLLESGDELIIVCHNNPDPDCLASAFALARIAAHLGIDERRIVYSGDISHQQNRAFINLLEMNIRPFETSFVTDRPEGSLVAFVDHSTPGANNQVPADTPIDIVIDHHQSEEIQARYVDHRESVGATATILTEYVRDLEIEITPPLATALLFAIRRETLSFLRGTTSAEYTAASVLHDHADRDMLRQLSQPSVSGATVDAIADAIENRQVRASVLISHVGRTTERDALPQAADYLATLEGVQTAIVFGIVDDVIHLSGRSTDARINLGSVLSGAFSDLGSAGGHRGMAGGEVSLGILGDYTQDDTTVVRIVEQVVTDRLLATLNIGDES
jgi:nanoRNase/pAp phosphatase (c-di-AMP/oligoRNAs hydrolase)